MGKGSHDPQADEPAKLAARSLTMKRSASRDLLGDALDCAASCIDAAALDAYRLDYASFQTASRYPDTSLRCLRVAFAAPPRYRCVAGVPVDTRRATEAPNLCKSTHTRATHAASAAQLCRQRPPEKRCEKLTHPCRPRRRRAAREPQKNAKKNAGIDWERCAARGANSRRPTTTRPP